MAKVERLVMAAAMLFITALCSAEGTGATTATTAAPNEVVSKPNGNERGITFWAVTDTLRSFTYLKVVTPEDGKAYVAKPDQVTRLRGIIEEEVKADSLGQVTVKVVLAKGETTEHRSFLADSTWLGAKVGRGVAYTKGYFFDGKSYLLAEDVMLLSKQEVDGQVYREFNCEFQEPKFEATAVGVPALPALTLDQFLGKQTKSASTRAGGLRIMGKKSAAEQTRDDIVAAINDPSCTVRSRTRVVGN